MWHYLFFIVLVKVKDSTEYTGPESYVAKMIKVGLILTHRTLVSYRNISGSAYMSNLGNKQVAFGLPSDRCCYEGLFQGLLCVP